MKDKTKQAARIDKLEGAHITGGEFHIGGDFVAHDKIVGVSPSLDPAFEPILQAIKMAPPEQQDNGLSKLTELKRELSKGKQADDSRVATIIDELVKLVPSAVSATVRAFAMPVINGMVGPVTRFFVDHLGT